MTTPKLQQRVVRHSRSSGPGHPDVWGIYEPDTGSIQYICADPATRKAALIDVVWNFDPKSYRFSTESMEQVLDLVRENDLEVACCSAQMAQLSRRRTRARADGCTATMSARRC